MTFALSLRIKTLALTGLLLAAGAAGTLMLAHNRSTSQPVVVPVRPAVQPQTATHHPTVVAKPAVHAVQLTSNLPSPLRTALVHSPLVVAVVYAPGDAVDAEVVAQARLGAASVHAPVVLLNVRNDRIAGATAAWMKNVFEPAVLIVERPGTIAVELDGYADEMTVAQAVVNARQ